MAPGSGLKLPLGPDLVLIYSTRSYARAQATRTGGFVQGSVAVELAESGLRRAHRASERGGRGRRDEAGAAQRFDVAHGLRECYSNCDGATSEICRCGLCLRIVS